MFKFSFMFVMKKLLFFKAFEIKIHANIKSLNQLHASLNEVKNARSFSLINQNIFLRKNNSHLYIHARNHTQTKIRELSMIPAEDELSSK